MKAPPLKHLYEIQTHSTNVGWIYNYISIHPHIRMSRPRPMLFSFRILGRGSKFIFLTFSNKFCFQTQQKTSHCSQCLASFHNQPCSGKSSFSGWHVICFAENCSGAFRTDFSPNMRIIFNQKSLFGKE